MHSQVAATRKNRHPVEIRSVTEGEYNGVNPTFPFIISFIVISSYSSSTFGTTKLRSGKGRGGKQFRIFLSFFLGEPSTGVLAPDDDAALDAELRVAYTSFLK